ncbi:hypothetical protein ASPZODRAFT_137437 [Penicilliopsis zonata CBS 506.65]|uniref:Uncharacterized protein n=1 Tax=Penicilliopsis zonata CBS 506.65 TaxID=1073090 RepID=A0A1L9S4W8_9EURO|nr:hypothetical protein ASPZODRAFT_137437 [Penicilliopsis zonata CBS 506.65]OJJ42207.1 hypothetical protein ASPZODRAFT_137437 [Penicilliopsis zonata CBS 506.65]
MRLAAVSLAVVALTPGASAFFFRMPWIPLTKIPVPSSGGSGSTPCAVYNNNPNFASCSSAGGLFPAFDSNGAFQGCL